MTGIGLGVFAEKMKPELFGLAWMSYIMIILIFFEDANVNFNVNFVIFTSNKYLYFLIINSWSNKNQSPILSFYGSSLNTYKSQSYCEITSLRGI